MKNDFEKAEMLKWAINFEFLEVFGWECDSQIPQIKPLGVLRFKRCELNVYLCVIGKSRIIYSAFYYFLNSIVICIVPVLSGEL